MILFIIVDSKRKCPKEIDINIKELKLIWSLHQSVAGEHIRSASYLLRYKTSSSSFVARPLAPPVIVDLDQVTASGASDLETSISDMATKKRKIPNLFDQSSSANEEAKKNKKDIPASGPKNKDVSTSKTIPTSAKETSMKPPSVPKDTTPSIEGVVITQEETAPVIEGVSLKRLRKGLSERPKENVVPSPSTLAATIPTPNVPNFAKDLIKSWVDPEIQKVESSLPRKKITDLAAQHASSVSVIGLIPFSSNIMLAF